MTEHAAVFDGLDDYVETADHPDYSIASTGELTVVALIRPDSLEMPSQERTGYVHWLGKGVPGQDEWTFRMYQLGNTEGRENRISCYAFNLDARAGGTRFGIGSHFQDELTPGQWLLVAGAWDATRVSTYRDGVLRDSDLLDQSATGGVTITPSMATPRSASALAISIASSKGRSAGSHLQSQAGRQRTGRPANRPHGRHPRQRDQRHRRTGRVLAARRLGVRLPTTTPSLP